MLQPESAHRNWHALPTINDCKKHAKSLILMKKPEVSATACAFPDTLPITRGKRELK
jgi:hypothetical protein